MSFQVLYRHGKRQQSLTFSTRKAAAEVKALFDALGPDRALRAMAAEESDQHLTVDDLAEKFFEWKARDVEDRTLNEYRRDYRNWWQPWLGHRAAELVDESDVQQVIDHMAERLAPKSVADRHMILNSMYKFGKAKSRKLVTHNPCLETDLPKRKKKPPKGTTVPEFRAILAAAAARNPDAHDLILYLGETGWRWSEGAALRVMDVDDNGADVYVTVGSVFRIDGNWKQVVAEDEAKSYRAFRRIRLFPESAAMVRRRLIGRGPSDLVFTNTRGRAWSQNTFLRETWPKILTDAGLWKGAHKSPTPHWLRHMHVAVCAAAGVPMHEIQRRIGHEHYSTTVDVYGGMIGDMSDETLSKAGEIMAGRRSAPNIAPGVIAGELA